MSKRKKILLMIVISVMVLVGTGLLYFFLSNSSDTNGDILDKNNMYGDLEVDQIESIVFKNTNNVPKNVISSWDAGVRQNGSIMAYALDTNNNGAYELYIGQKGKVVLGDNTTINMFKSSSFSESELKKIDVTYLDTSNVTSMKQMFDFCTATEIIGLETWNTSNVTDMSGMFWGSAATNLDLSNFDTSKVTDMSGMFYNSNAITLNLSGFDTSNVTDMYEMFSGSKATSLNLSSFDTSSVTNMSEMFGLSVATTLDLSSFDTSIVIDMSEMFYNSKTTRGYARTQADADKFNASYGKPSGLTFVVKK